MDGIDNILREMLSDQRRLFRTRLDFSRKIKKILGQDSPLQKLQID